MLQDGEVSAENKDVIEKYRTIHVINDVTHLNTLKNHGWTKVDFERGTQIVAEEVRKQSINKQLFSKFVD